MQVPETAAENSTRLLLYRTRVAFLNKFKQHRSLHKT